jgi:hypothetical protein
MQFRGNIDGYPYLAVTCCACNSFELSLALYFHLSFKNRPILVVVKKDFF